MKKQIALIVGHEPGGGAEGERVYNIAVRGHMVANLAAAGFDVFSYDHVLKSYGARQDAMRRAVMKAQPHNLICVELHYNDVDTPLANGHQFHYNASPGLARAFADAWRFRFPASKPRQDNGIYHTPTGDGSGFLRKAPGLAVLTEPFFHSNPDENKFFAFKQKSVADTYCDAIKAFSSHL